MIPSSANWTVLQRRLMIRLHEFFAIIDITVFLHLANFASVSCLLITFRVAIVIVSISGGQMGRSTETLLEPIK